MAARPSRDDGRDFKRVPGLALGRGSFDKIIHEQQRLGILSTLAVNSSLSFSELKELLDATDGNLSVHARKLEDAGYITCKKQFKGRTPQTLYKISAKGRSELTKYLNHMEALIRATRGESETR